jgi:small subunit ribosomal protein S16
MLRIRLSRVGKKKQPSYRIVVADSRAPRDGAFLKIIGHYNPLTDPATLVVQEEEAVRWLTSGAQPSETAAKLLTRAGIMEKAGRQPARYQGKEMPAAEKKKKKEDEPVAQLAAPTAKAKKAQPDAIATTEAEAEKAVPEATAAAEPEAADASPEAAAPDEPKAQD